MNWIHGVGLIAATVFTCNSFIHLPVQSVYVDSIIAEHESSYNNRTDVESDIRHWSRLPVSEQADGWQGVATRTTRVVSDTAIWYAIRWDKGKARTGPYARVSVDWFVNTSATSDAGESAGVYTQIRMQFPCSSDMTEPDKGHAHVACRAATELASVFCSRNGVHAGLHRQGEVGHSRWTTADDWCSATAGPECRAVRRHGTAAAKLYACGVSEDSACWRCSGE